MIIKNIEQKVKLSLIVSVAAILGGSTLGAIGLLSGYTVAKESGKQVYVITDGLPQVATRTSTEEMFDIEAKNTVRTFHRLFFTLPPDDKYIEKTLDEALYLIDESGVRQKNALMDKGFYTDILAHSANFSIVCDSITINKEDMTFVYYGKQMIQKKYTLTERELITSGGLRPIPRTENNPFGYLIVDYKTLSNKDLSSRQR